MKLKLIITYIFAFLISIVSGTTPKLQIGDGGLISGKPCAAPCFWNITPGVTSEKQALKILGTIGNVYKCDRWDAVENGIEKSIACDNVWIYFDNKDTVSELSIKSSKRITVKQILERYGNPDAVYVKSDGIDKKRPYKMDLIYLKQYLVIGLPSQNDKYYEVKPTTAIERVLYSNKNEFPRFIGSFNQHWTGYGIYPHGNSLPTVGHYRLISESEFQEAQLILYNLHFYGVDILVDWGTNTQNYGFNEPHEGGRSGLLTVDTWKEGRWTLDELYLVQEAVQNMDFIFKHNLKNILGPVQISIVDPSTFPKKCTGARGCTIGNHVKLADNNLPPKNSPDPTNPSNYNVVESGSVINFDQWTVVHELAHVLENHYALVNNDPFSYIALSDQLVMKTGGQYNTPGGYCQIKKWRPGCNNIQYFFRDIPPKGVNNNFSPQEDFAESVAAYVFPKTTQRLVENIYGKNASASEEQKRFFYYPDYTKTLRWDFINALIYDTQKQW
jgi:hypothetical protein